jgi:hypothetical protein
MGRGRPQGPRKIEWKLQIPEELAMKVELLLFDGGEGRVPYGKRGGLVTKLLGQWVAKRIEDEPLFEQRRALMLSGARVGATTIVTEQQSGE